MCRQVVHRGSCVRGESVSEDGIGENSLKRRGMEFDNCMGTRLNFFGLAPIKRSLLLLRSPSGSRCTWENPISAYGHQVRRHLTIDSHMCTLLTVASICLASVQGASTV
jgi:hypothetical protein